MAYIQEFNKKKLYEKIIENAKPEDWQKGYIVDILNVNFSNKYYYVESYFHSILREMVDCYGATIRITRQSEADKIRAEIERLQALLVEIEPSTQQENQLTPRQKLNIEYKNEFPPPPEGFGEWILHEGNNYPLDGDAREFKGVVLFKDGTISEPAKFWCWQQALSNPIIAYALPLKQNGGGA